MAPMAITGMDRRSAITAGLALAGSAAIPQAATPARPPRHGGSIRVAAETTSTADTLDPAKGGNGTDYMRHFMLYSGLTETGSDLVARPKLAESMTSADRMTWHFRLRRGVRFHSGRPLTSADVVWSLSRHRDPRLGSKMATIARQFVDVRTDGPHDVIVKLSGPNADLPAILSQSHFLIVPAGEASPSGNGTGAFRLDQFKLGVRTVVVRNQEYWLPQRGWLDRIEMVGIPDEVSRVNALLSGDVHLVMGLNAQSTKRIDASPGHGVLATPSGQYTDLILRQDRLPGGNPDFVLAIKYLVDRPLIKRALFRNYALIGNDHPIPPFHPYFNPHLPQTGLDLDRARWHLARAGLKGVRLPVYASPAAQGSVDMASVLQEYGARIGLELAVNRVPADGYWSTHWLKHPMGFGNTNPRPTADLVFSLFYKSDAEWNESGWRNPRFDALLVRARGETDDALRREMYWEMQGLVRDHCGVAIPVFITLIDGFDRRIGGLQSVPLGGLMGYQFAEHVWWSA